MRKILCIGVFTFTSLIKIHAQSLTYQKYIGNFTANDFFCQGMAQVNGGGVMLLGYQFLPQPDSVNGKFFFIDTAANVIPKRVNYFLPSMQFQTGLATTDLIADAANNIITAGFGYFNNATARRIGIIKFDTSGAVFDENNFQIHNYPGNLNYSTKVVKQCSDNGYLLTGLIDAYNTTYLIKVDSNLNYQWGKEYKKNSRVYFEKGIQTIDGNYLAAGASEIYYSGTQVTCALLVKCDSTGNVLWSKKYRGGIAASYIWDVHEFANGDILACGQLNDSLGSSASFVMRCDPAGNILWSEKYLLPTFIFRNMTVLASGDIVIAGGAFLGFGDATILVKLDSIGQQKWAHYFYDADVNKMMIPTSDGGFALMGNNYATLTKTDSLGNSGCLQDTVTLPHSPGMYWLTDTVIADTLMVTSISLPMLTGPGTFIADTNLCIGYTFITGHHQKLNQLKIYPNPTQDKMMIEFGNWIPELKTILITDAVGKIISNQKFTGNKKEMDVSKLNSGIYFVEISTDKENYWGKFVKE